MVSERDAATGDEPRPASASRGDVAEGGGSVADGTELEHAFLAVASHELRTPIQAIRLNVAMMRTRVEGAADEVPRRWLVERLQRTERIVDRMARLVDGLLNLAEFSSGRMQLRLETLDLAELARDVVADSEERLRWARCPCVVDAPDPVVATCDRFRIVMLLENLLGNAMKYAPGTPVHVRVHGDEGEARLVVADEGPGISPADRQRVFERFERGGPRRREDGFGLGLWIVRMIAEAHGGSVALASSAGATFTVTLPRATSRAPSGSP